MEQEQSLASKLSQIKKNSVDNTKAKIFCITFANGQISLFRSGDEDPTIAPDVLKDFYGNHTCVKEYVTISQLRTRVDMINANLKLKNKISLDAAMNMVFYKEAVNISLFDNHKRINIASITAMTK
jgi:hypothetical protein